MDDYIEANILAIAVVMENMISPGLETVKMSNGVRSTKMNCVFCQRILNGEYKYSNDYAVAFEPLNPVTTGHMLIVPRVHINYFTENAYIAGKAMEFASELYENSNDINLITSKGPNATQTIYHMHIHIVPRWENDGLMLPWTN